VRRCFVGNLISILAALSGPISKAPGSAGGYLLADENLRTRVAEKTEGVRNVILALAFGSLAANQNDAG
jgi:hypothetical protein